MKWKQFKKERIFLNYTIMLLPHSQKKAIHFKTPVWTFGLLFLGILALTGVSLFFAGSRIQLEAVRREKSEVESERELLAEQKRQAEEENEILRQARELQEQELNELEQKTRDTIDELAELVERENQIREELGLQITDSESQTTPAETEGMSSAPGYQIASTGVPAVLLEGSEDFLEIQKELGYLQSSLEEKTSQYEDYMRTIQDKKETGVLLRSRIVDDALQFVGNAYVYGGNDPHTGVDCSGFTKYIMSSTAGVNLNRTAAAQAMQGTAVSADAARPGDLVFYSGGGGYIDHVAIYIGNGQIVHAADSQTGITTSDMYYMTPVKIVNVLGD
jgi:hypothetical protein